MFKLNETTGCLKVFSTRYLPCLRNFSNGLLDSVPTFTSDTKTRLFLGENESNKRHFDITVPTRLQRINSKEWACTITTMYMYKFIN